ncbi:hypothetical protein ACH5RR_001508 [Cinchona calisaya]|uniref:HMA domain-containing protein n=1 Tax=Cinchona calisaya TaxID=153742 RepID=A0ABD3B3K8_9GENT
MAAEEILEDPPTPTNYKKWVFKVSIHCEGCKKKVKKILNQVEGVYEIDIDTKQQKVTVTGNVEADTLLRKLTKSGKHAELWPEKADHKEKTSNKSKTKEKMNGQDIIEEPSKVSVNIKNISTVKEIKQPPLKGEAMVQEPSKNSQGGGGGGAARKNEESSGSGVAEVTSEGGKTKGGGDKAVTKELKMDEKKPESGSGGAQPPLAAEKNEKGGESDNTISRHVGKVGSGGGNDGNNSGKKKNKKGQNGNFNRGEQSSAAQEGVRSQKPEDGPQDASVPDHHFPPPHQSYDHYPPQFYGPPGPPPIYAVSYNTANPVGSNTASYYAPPQPNSYVYSHSRGPEIQAPPSDLDAYTRQPLDSFEIFSDENPNGCSIM